MRKVIFLLLDGARYDCLNKYLSLGYLPNLSKIIDNQGSNLSAISVFPSTTGPAYVPFLMGSLAATFIISLFGFFGSSFF